MKRFAFHGLKWHIVIIVVLMLVLSVSSWFVFAENTGNSADDVNGGQSGQGSMFSRIIDKIENKIQDINGQWDVAWKSFLVEFDSIYAYYLTKTTSSDQVIIGSGNWLFYKAIGDGDTIGDYEGRNVYTQEEMEAIARSVLRTQEELNMRGISYALFIAPNKENIYSEYMPETYIQAEKSRTEYLVEYLQAKEVDVVWPKDELKDIHLSTQVYYSYDTHWNQLGAYIGVKSILALWCYDMPELADREITARPLKENYHLHGEDDLAKMAGLRSVLSDETEYEVAGTVPMDWETYANEQNANQVSHYHNENAVNDSSVFLVGDSFRSSMVPALREQFADVYVIYRYAYTPQLLDEIAPEYVIFEYAERYSNSI